MQHSTLQNDLQIIKQLATFRLQQYAGQETTSENNSSFSSPVAHQSFYDDFLIARSQSFEERTILLLALLPYLQPNFFEPLIFQFFPQGGDIPEIGGAKGTHHRGMLATGETGVFLLTDKNDLHQKFSLIPIFSEDHFFAKENILHLENVPEGEPPLSGKIILSADYADYFTTGKISKPRFGTEFPAKHLTTSLLWKDMVLQEHTLQQIENIRTWLHYHQEIMKDKNIGKHVKQGYRALFYGPSGTGKTTTATLLGKELQQEVYRIDLSQVVSKYIGETEKNLEKVFSKAENKNWILFFDEADALFGKRSNVQSAHDKYANQETAYLLQRVEDYPGLVILASNFKNNIDSAFLRRFNAIIYFPLPTPEERCQLWKKLVPEKLKASFSFEEIAKKYELTGAAIVNVMHYAALQSLMRKDNALQLPDVLQGIKYEFLKEDKFINP